jgi:hypothetical protein
MVHNLVYLNYWRRKGLLSGEVPSFPVLRWWKSDGVAESERVCFEAIRDRPSVLDVGAGDLKHLHMFRSMGYQGDYRTLDTGHEFKYDYTELHDVDRTFGAVLCMDVLEHLPLEAGLEMIVRIVDRLEEGGVLVIQTPNARCVRHPLSTDMTHLHCYNAHDLWSYLTCLGLDVRGYRVVFSAERRGLLTRLRESASAYLITRVLGCDYADGLLIIARKTSSGPSVDNPPSVDGRDDRATSSPTVKGLRGMPPEHMPSSNT